MLREQIEMLLGIMKRAYLTTLAIHPTPKPQTLADTWLTPGAIKEDKLAFAPCIFSGIGRYT